MKPTELWTRGRKKEAISHSGGVILSVKVAQGLQILLLSRHPEVLKDRRKDEIAVTFSVPGKMSFWVPLVATSHLSTEMKALLVVTALAQPFFPH